MKLVKSVMLLPLFVGLAFLPRPAAITARAAGAPYHIIICSGCVMDDSEPGNFLRSIPVSGRRFLRLGERSSHARGRKDVLSAAWQAGLDQR